MKVHSPLLQQCFAEVLAEAPQLVGRCVDAAVVGLQEAEKQGREVAQRDRLATAWWHLQQLKPLWVRTYPEVLRKALQGEDFDASLSRPMPLSESTYLSLVEDEAVTESMESTRLVQSVQPLVEQELSVLDALMSSLIGLDQIRAEMNPLRPEVFVRVLRDVFSANETDVDIRTLWVRHCGRPLGGELKTLYGRLVQMLQRAQVREAGYRVRLTAQSPSGAGRAGGSTAPGALRGADGRSLPDTGFDSLPGDDSGSGLPSMPQLGRIRPRFETQLYQDFFQREDSRYEQPLEPSYYRQVNREIAAMEQAAVDDRIDESRVLENRTQYRDLPVVDRPAREVDISTQLSQSDWGDYATAHQRSRVLMELKQKARRVAQAVGLDVVRTLVNQVAQDPQLLAPVREAVVALEPALLRMAMANPRFFREDVHPARRLIESVAQRSFKYNDEFASEFESFFLPVQQAFKELNASKTEDPDVFANALAGLQHRWDEQDQEALKQQDDSLQQIRHAEARQALADQVAWDLSQRPDVDHAPGVILDFLYGPWALVIASAQLSAQEGQTDPGGYRKVVSNLLWSVRKEVTLKRPAELFQIIPGLLNTLHSGLDMLGKSREETKPFFDALMRLHEPALSLRRARIRGDATASAPAPLEISTSSMSMELDETLPATPEQRKPRQNAQPWLGRHEIEAAGFADTVPTDFAELHELEPSQSGASDDAGNSQQDHEDDQEINAAAVLAGLREGDWVDLYSRREWLRAQLIWASSRGTLFMFVSRGGCPHSMTKRSCERLISGRLLRPIDSRGVVHKAIKNLAEQQARSEEPVSA